MSAATLAVSAAAVGAFAVSAWATGRLARHAAGWLVDHPNERSLHQRPTPRSGGLGVVSGLAAALAVLAASGVEPPPWVLVGAAVVALVSFLDDLGHVNKAVRLAVHILAAGCALAGGFAGEALLARAGGLTFEDAAAAALALAVVVWLTNLYNFMDGMDGFAGGMTAIGFGCLALLGALAGDLPFAAFNLCVAAAAAGFLVHNFPPARIFLGDLGSSVLGFLAGCVIVWGHLAGVCRLWVGLLVFSPFVVDATITLLTRILRGEPFWRSHKSHYYQRLVELGWGHRRTVVAEYALMAGCGASAVAATLGPRALEPWWVVAWGGVYAALAVRVRTLERLQGRA